MVEENKKLDDIIEEQNDNEEIIPKTNKQKSIQIN